MIAMINDSVKEAHERAQAKAKEEGEKIKIKSERKRITKSHQYHQEQQKRNIPNEITAINMKREKRLG